MDCCNYMQYRHHQPYYGSQYYEGLPAYHGEFYGQQVYQEYYNAPYYHQQWPCVTPFPDYVYNPKEARIRKAMRDATRERPIGTSPMLPRASVRRAPSHGWATHDDLMMPPMASLRSPMEAQCGFPGGQFMGTMNGYDKMEAAPIPPPPPATYMQSNPLAQLQQHAEMWPDYQSLRPRSSGVPDPYMMGEVPPYQAPELSGMLEKQPATPPPLPAKDAERFAFDRTEDGDLKVSDETSEMPGRTRSTPKPLPDFNEAFGSTERGRFQSPPDPRLAPNKGYLDYFFDSAPIKFEDFPGQQI